MALLACTGQERRLTFWVGGAPQEVAYWENLVAEFEARSGVAVDIIRQPASTDQRKQGLVIALEANQPDPDLFLMDIVWITQFVQSDWLLPLDRFIKGDTISLRDFFPRVVAAVDRHGGRTYALPAFLDVGLLYYRKDLLAAQGFAGPPQTWDALVTQALAVQEAQRRQNPRFNGFVWQGAQYEGLVCTFLEFVVSHGGRLTSDGSVSVTGAGTAAALTFMQDLIQRYRISPPNTYTEMQEEEVRRSFQRGNALFERNWLYAWRLHQGKDSAVRGRVGLAALPHVPGAPSAATLGGWHLGISRTSDAPDQAWQLAAFLLSREIQTRLLLDLGWYSGRRDVYTAPEVRRRMPYVDRLQGIVAHAVSRPDLAYYAQISRIIQRYVNDCLAGKRSAEAALAAMQAEIDRIGRFYEPS
jgi:multiple sugar transport system substrate-binding protein